MIGGRRLLSWGYTEVDKSGFVPAQREADKRPTTGGFRTGVLVFSCTGHNFWSESASGIIIN